MTDGERVQLSKAKGRPMLQLVGKRPLREVRSFPAQLMERLTTTVPRRQDLVDGTSRIQRSAGEARPVALRITDMLGEEVLVIQGT